jgi:uncharacterized glyoxalase superfamily protein PhnB
MSASGQQGSTVTSTVEVSVDPDTAFTAFTEEVDLWWVRGPINHHAGGRMAAMRCEPGVGGRLLEVYDDAAGDALQLARITAWEPGRRLAWESSLDDVETEVSFEASGAGTVVTVTARVPAGGHDRGGTSWVRVVPKWFGPWCARREHAPRTVQDLARLALGVSYARPAAAARWLAGTFGFESPDPLPEGADPLPEGPYGPPWIEFRLGNSSLMVFKAAEDPGGPAQAHMPWVYVTDIEAHYRRAADGGAEIISKLASPWGLPMYVAADPEGNHWTFAQARPTM